MFFRLFSAPFLLSLTELSVVLTSAKVEVIHAVVKTFYGRTVLYMKEFGGTRGIVEHTLSIHLRRSISCVYTKQRIVEYMKNAHHVSL